MKRFAALFLAIAALASFLAVPAQAAPLAPVQVETPAPNQVFPEQKEKSAQESKEKAAQSDRERIAENIREKAVQKDAQQGAQGQKSMGSAMQAFSVQSAPINAQTLALGVAAIAAIAEEEDVAWFQYTALEDCLVEFSSNIDTDDEYDELYVQVYDAEMNDIGGTWGDPNFSAPVSLSASKVYYFSVQYGYKDDGVAVNCPVMLKKLDAAELALGTEVAASIAREGDVSWFRFTAQEDFLATFSSNITADGYDELYARIYDAKLSALTGSWGYPGFSCSFLLQAGKTYYFSVRYGYMDDGSAAKCPVKLSKTAVTNLSLNADAAASFAKEGDTAWFKYTATEAQTAVFASNPAAQAEDGFHVCIYNRNMSIVTQVWSSAEFSLALKLLADETYYFSVLYNYDGGGASAVTFPVKLREVSPAALSLNADIQVSVGTAGEKVWYQYTPAEKTVVEFRAANSAAGTFVRLYDANMYEITTAYGYTNLSLVQTLQPGETYYFEVGYSDKQTGSFAARFEAFSPPVLTLDTQTAVSFARQGDTAWFQYTAPENFTATFSSNISASGYDGLYVRLYNQDLYEIAYAWGEPNFLLTRQLSAGETYYFSVQYDYGEDGNAKNCPVTLCKFSPQSISLNTETLTEIPRSGGMVCYEFKPAENMLVSFTSVSSTGNTRLILRDASFYVRTSSYGYPNASLAYVLQAGETYYLEAGYSGSQTGSFAVKLSALNPPQLSMNTDVTANIATAGHAVWYAYTPTVTEWVSLKSNNSTQNANCNVFYAGDSGSHNYLTGSGGIPDFECTFRAEAGTAYYFALSFENPAHTGDIPIRLEKSPAPEGYVENEYLQFYVKPNGYYTLGTVAGNPDIASDNNKMLLFGHPGSTTSETLLSVNGNTKFFDSCNSALTKISEDGLSAVTMAQYGDIVIKQLLTFEMNAFTGRRDIACISYEMTNTGDTIASLGGRIMMDTMLGDNDGAPFRVNGVNVTQETEYAGSSVPQYWQCFDSYNNTAVFANGTFFTNSMEKPDKVQFTGWWNLRGYSKYNYQVDSEEYVTNDSAVAVYFDEKMVAPGGTRSFKTWYGIGEFSDSSANEELALSVAAPRVLLPNSSGGYISNPFKVTAYIENKTGTAKTNVQAVLTLPAEMSFTGGSVADITIPSIQPGETVNCAWDVFAAPQTEMKELTGKITVTGGEGSLDADFLTTLNAVSTVIAAKRVTYDLNYAGAAQPTSADVMYGTVLTKPADPQRAGYSFRGWFANKACEGIDWFNQWGAVPAQTRIEADIRLYAKWEKNEKVLGVQDLFSFTAQSTNFGAGTVLETAYLESLLNGLTPAEQQLLQKAASGSSGRGFGMACAAALMKAKRLNPSFYDAFAQSPKDLKAPKDSNAAAQLVEYYRLLQYTDCVLGEIAAYAQMTPQEKVQAAAALINSSAAPVVLALTADGADAVYAVAYACENSSIQIWNTESGALESIAIAENGALTLNGKTIGIMAAIDPANAFFSAKNPEEYIRNGAAPLPAAKNTGAYLIADYKAFTITHSNGKSASINGSSVTGDLDVSFLAEFPAAASEYCEYLYRVPALQGNETLKISAANSGALWQLQYLFADAASGSLQSASSAVSGEVIFGASGLVQTALGVSGSQSVASTVNNSALAWDTVRLSGDCVGFTLQNVSGAAEISAQTAVAPLTFSVAAEGKFSIQAANRNSTIQLPDAALTQAAATLRQAGGKIVLEDKQSGAELASTEITYSVQFNTQGGSAAAAVHGLKAGDKIEKPANPTFAGYSFNGWFTADGKEWNFSTDAVSGNLTLYAQWVQNTTLRHTVTFKAEGSEDTVMTLLTGTDLSAIMPPVPEKAGRIGMWDLPEGERIVTSDIIVRAMYYGEENTCKVNVTSTVGGTVARSGETQHWSGEREFTMGGTVSLTITPNSLYAVGSVLVNGTAAELTGGNTLPLVLDRDLEVQVNFIFVGIPLVSIALNKTAAEIVKGETETLAVVSFNPSDTTDDKTIVWTTSDAAVASVENGVVTAVNAGTAVISAKVGSKEALCTVTVTDPPPAFVAVTGISGVPTSAKAGQNLTLKGTVAPADATNKTISWSVKSAGQTGASISGSTLKTKAGGTVVVTAMVKNGKTAETNYSQDFTIQVQPAEPTAVAVNKTAVTLGVKETFTPTVTLSPAGAKGSCSWSSSDSAIAKVDKTTGKITAVKAGKATVTVTTDNKLKKSITVTVKAAPVSVSLNKTSLTIGKGETFTLTAAPNSGTASYKKTWSSSDSKVAAVDASGKITAKAAGTATITVKTFNGKTKTCKVTVKAAPSAVSLSKTSLTLGKGETFTLKAALNSSSAASYKKTWSSSDSKVAAVDASGKITAKAAGSAAITVKTFNGKTKTCKVTVKAAPKSVSLNKTSLAIGKGETFVLKATPNSGAVSNKKTWSSSNTKVVSVDANGKITARATGSATITVKTFNSKTKTCKVTVKAAPKSVSLNKTSLTLGKGEAFTLTAASNSGAASVKKSWKSSNSKVVSVDASGKLKAVGTGTATITVTTYNGKTKTCKVTVKAAPTSVKLNKSSVTLTKGKTAALSASLNPSSAASLKRTWSSSNTKVAKVDAGGKVTAVGKGSATITVKTFNGKTKTCKVTVK